MRHRPALVTAPTLLPVTVAEVKEWLRVTTTDDDDQIERDIRSAVAHYEGWNGILGILLCEQTWRQDFDDWGWQYDGSGRALHLPLGPVVSIDSVKWRADDGTISTVAADDYSLKRDAAGRAFIRFGQDYSFPGDLHDSAAVMVEYKGGWPTVTEATTVPDDLRRAIALRVQKLYDAAASADAEHLERAERALIDKYRR